MTVEVRHKRQTVRILPRLRLNHTTYKAAIVLLATLRSSTEMPGCYAFETLSYALNLEWINRCMFCAAQYNPKPTAGSPQEKLLFEFCVRQTTYIHIYRVSKHFSVQKAWWHYLLQSLYDCLFLI